MQMKFQSEKKNLKSSRENFGQLVKFGKQKYQIKIFYTCEKKKQHSKKVFSEVTLVLQKKHCKTITVPIQIYNLPKYTSRLQCIAKSLREYFHSSLVKLFGIFLENVRYYRGSERLTSLIENTRYFGSSVAYNLRGIHLLIEIQNLR